MTEQQRPATRTQIPPQELYVDLRASWVALIGSAPTRESILVLLAHWALETGFGHYCWNNNLGNVKHVAGDGRDYYQIHCTEVINGKVVPFDPPNPACSFRSFDSLAAGVVDYMTLLRGQFGFAWPAVEAGDVVDFCHRLKQRGYYTADESSYTAGVQRCYHQLDAIIESDLPQERPTMPEFVLPDDAQDTPKPDGVA